MRGRERPVTSEAELREKLRFEDGVTSHQPKNAGTFRNWKREGNGPFPRASRGRTALPAHTILVGSKTQFKHLTSRTVRINSCRFKPLTEFVVICYNQQQKTNKTGMTITPSTLKN